MTDNISRMYELAGVKKELVCNCSSENLRICKVTKEYCSYSEFEYTFTDTKQLKLIKWLSSSCKGILISDMGEGEFNISTGFYYGAKHIMNFRNNKDLGIVIASFINDLWQDLSDEQREEVRGILR